MAACPYCGKTRLRLFHHCDPAAVTARATSAAVARMAKQGKIGDAIVDLEQGLTGANESWSPTVYANYYIQSSPVYSAIRKRAISIVRPPLRVYTGDPNGDKKPVPANHPLQVLLDKANPHWTRSDLWQATSTYKDIWGQAVWALEKSGESSPPTAIYLLRSDRCRVISDRSRYIAGMEYRQDGMPKRVFRPDEFVWFRNINPLNEFAGLSPMAVVRLPVDMAMEASRYNRNQFKNGPMVDNVAFSAGESMSEDEITDTVERLKKRYSGSDKAKLPLVLGDMKATNLGLSTRDMEWIASLRWALEETSRAFQVPKVLLDDLERATYENINAAERILWRGLASELQFYQEELNETLCPMFGPGLFCEFDLSKIEALQPDANAVHERVRADIAGGLITINEGREEIGRDPHPAGDILLMPISLVPVDMAGDNLLPPEPTEDDADDEEGEKPAAGEESWRRYRQWPEKVLDRVGAQHVKRLTRHERLFRLAQQKLFDEQERAILAALAAKKSLDITHLRAIGDLFNVQEWVKRYILLGRPILTRALADEAQAQIAAFNLGISFDLQSTVVQGWLTDRTAFWATRVNDETARLITQEIAAGIEAGESIKDMQERVHRVFLVSDAFRTEMIARTEVNSATNRGAMEAYSQSKVVESKMWLAAVDDRTRPSHLAAHRQTVAIGAQFTVGSELLDHPGDTKGSAAEIINCRCALAPVVRRPSRHAPVLHQEPLATA